MCWFEDFCRISLINLWVNYISKTLYIYQLQEQEEEKKQDTINLHKYRFLKRENRPKLVQNFFLKFCFFFRCRQKFSCGSFHPPADYTETVFCHDFCSMDAFCHFFKELSCTTNSLLDILLLPRGLFVALTGQFLAKRRIGNKQQLGALY